jgi:hypothetical protein
LVIVFRGSRSAIADPFFSLAAARAASLAIGWTGMNPAL